MLKLSFILFLVEHKKDPGVPNLFPFKEEVLKQAEEKKRRVIFLGVHLINVHVTGQNYIHIKLFLTLVDSQFPFSPSPNYSWVRARRERTLRINLG